MFLVPYPLGDYFPQHRGSVRARYRLGDGVHHVNVFAKNVAAQFDEGVRAHARARRGGTWSSSASIDSAVLLEISFSFSADGRISPLSHPETVG